MHINSTDTIAGQPILAIRQLFKKTKVYGGSLSTIASELDVDQDTARQIFDILCAEGYIEPDETSDSTDKDNIYWRTTLNGNSLALASARKPISRQTAERLLNEFLKRVKAVNACDDYAYYVKQVIVFGSYLTDSPKLSDIDLAIQLEFRYNDREKRSRNSEKRIMLAIESGRTFNTFFAEFLWPYNEILLFLKNRSPSISLHDLKTEGILSTSIPSKVLLEANAEIND